MDNNYHGTLTVKNIVEVGEKILEMIGTKSFMLTKAYEHNGYIPKISAGNYLNEEQPFVYFIGKIIGAHGRYAECTFNGNFGEWKLYVGDEVVLFSGTISVYGHELNGQSYYHTINVMG